MHERFGRIGVAMALASLASLGATAAPPIEGPTETRVRSHMTGRTKAKSDSLTRLLRKART